MINLHTATSLAEDLGLDLVDIYEIRKWTQMQASPLNDPDIVAEMVRNLSLEEFRKHLKINRLWYNCCKAKLWKRHEKAEAEYDRAVKHYKEATKAYGQAFWSDEESINKACEEYEKAYEERYTRFEEMVDIERALLQCGTISILSLNKINFPLKLTRKGK
jgi:transcription termination factor NusB